MATTDPIGGPVSACLESDLRGWVRRHGIVMWLDAGDDYGAFVERLGQAREAGRIPYDVWAFRGSHLELMVELESLAGGVEKPPMVVHLPRFNEELVKTTPLLELYLAGVRYRKKVDTLVTEAAGGRVKPEQIQAFRAQPDLTVEGADRWLAERLDDREGGLISQIRAMTLNAIVDDLLAGGFVARQIGLPGDEAVWDHLVACAGVPDHWRRATLPAGAARVRASDVAFVVTSWALCVEYVDDLRPSRQTQSPLLAGARGLPARVVETCRGLAGHLRERHAPFYTRVADETETLLVEEVDGANAADLGEIDTFRFEEGKVLGAALAALDEEQWRTAAEWARLRLDGGSFWVSESPTRRSAWLLVDAAATLGQALQAAGRSFKVGGLADAVELYVTDGAAVDRAHRQLEQLRDRLLESRLPCFELLRTRLDGLRRHWRAWANDWASGFNAACAQHGFLPDAGLQQRTLFEQVVRPMAAEAGVTAYFVVDALRYEMAQELYEALRDTPATTIHLRARLAELPTVTAVGMNVLAPVAQGGRLYPSLSGTRIQGFSTGAFRVSTPETRKRAMHDRIGGGTCPWLSLDDVVIRDSTRLKSTVSRANLVVVHSQEIDAVGEQGAGPAVFDQVMQKLRTAWHLLREAGVRRFVITADHGFLMLDESTGGAQAHGRKIDPKRRHVFSSVAVDHTGEVRVPLADLGYEGVGGHLMFPETTAVFDTGKRSMRFVHGGNSLQERVIPVLTLVHRSAAGGRMVSYAVEARAEEGVGGMHALRARVFMDAQGALDFGGHREVELSLTALNAPGVRVELCQTRQGAKLEGGSILATVDADFEVFFRLLGPRDARVRVEVGHPSAVISVTPCVVEQRFVVTAAPGAGARARAEVEISPPIAEGDDWLAELPEGGVRDVFRHLAERRAVTESEALAMLGGARPLRRFSRRFEAYAAKAPFGVRIDVVGGAKRYVREGGDG